MENRFVKSPLVVSIRSGTPRVVVFLGDVPTKVYNAVVNYSRASDPVLKEFYGPQFKSKLLLDKSGAGEWEDIEDAVAGGAEFDAVTGGDAPLDAVTGGDEFDQIDDEEIMRMLEDKPVAQVSGGSKQYSNISVYPEDKLSELKEKIFLATGIPAYRQHLVTDRGTTYRILIDGLYPVDSSDLEPQTTPPARAILDMPIDKIMYDAREIIRVEALDTFRLLGDTNGAITIYDLGDYTSKVQSQLMEIVKDTYQMEMLYYGFVLKFWPYLTRECWYEYVTNEREIGHKYPDLARDKAQLTAMYNTEQKLISAMYKHKGRSAKDISIAITQMTAWVGSAAEVNVRNLFNMLRVSRCIPEIHAWIARGDDPTKRYYVRKTHVMNRSDVIFPTGALMRTGITLAISLRKADQDSFHAKSSISTFENEQSRFLFLNIRENGRYYIRVVWNEEDEYGFEDSLKIVKKFVDPILDLINNTPRNVISGKLAPLTRATVNYAGLNVCMFYKRVIIESAFKAIKSAWEPYIRAGIVQPRPSQQADRYELMFRKGMVEFDVTAINKILTASSNMTLLNQYAWMSNATIKQKWDQNYSGRVFRMYHRTTDVKFEVLDIRENEFKLFYDYILDFIRVIGGTIQLKPTRDYTNVKKLRKLREQDPELYNLKKYGSKKVYSILCQNQRQPLIYTQDELRTMNPKDIKKLTQYWNFTLNKPAYYSCPNKNYPHLSYMVGVHPKHYCLPCCNKKPVTDEETRKNRITAICERDHVYTDEDQKSSRHVMGYGKDIDPGRLSKVPAAVSKLLYGVGEEGENKNQIDWYVFGVEQNVPGGSAGLLFSVANALDITLPMLVNKLIAVITPQMFNTLARGTLPEFFNSYKDLIAEFRNIYIKAALWPNTRFRDWDLLTIELLALLNIHTFTFVDTDGNIDLYVSDTLADAIEYLQRLGAAGKNLALDHKYIIMLQVRNRYYPIYLIEPDRFFTTGEVLARTFTRDHPAMQLFYTMITTHTHNNAGNVLHDLYIVGEFCKIAQPKYKLVKKYINRRNLCYSVQLEHNGELLYLPIDYSTHVPDEIPVTFETPERTGSAAAVARLIQDFNSFLQKMSDQKRAKDNRYITRYSAVTPTRLRKFNELYILEAGPFMFHFAGAPTNEMMKLPEVPIHYDPLQVNKLIIERAPQAHDDRMERIGHALYTNYLYQLFTIEIVNWLERERDTALRKQITDVIEKAPSGVAGQKQIRVELRALLREYPADYVTIMNQLTAGRNTIIGAIGETIYNFDSLTLRKLRSLDRASRREELMKIANNVAVEGALPPKITFPNVFTPCSDDNASHCTKKKLIVNQPLSELVELLAIDIESKPNFLNVWATAIMDFLKFTQYPGEVITIYKLE